MAKKTPTPIVDKGLEEIAAFEAAVVKAHDEKLAQGVPAAEVQQQRPGVVTLAASVAERLRSAYLENRRRGEQEAGRG